MWIIYLAFLSVLLAGVYIAFSRYLVRYYDGVGVTELSAFSLVWGLSFLFESVVVAVLARYGFASGAQIQSISLPPTVQALLISSTPVSGLLTISGIFLWLWFVLRYTRRIGNRERLVVVLLGTIMFLVATANGLVGALSSFGLLSLDQSVRADFHQFASVLEVLGTSVALSVGMALLFATAADYRPFSGLAAIGLSFPVVSLWFARYLYQFSLVTGFAEITVLRFVGLFIGLIGLWLSVTRCGLFDQLPASRAVGRQTAFDGSNTAIIVINSADQISDINAAGRELFGVMTDELIGSPLDNLLPADIDSKLLRRSKRITFGFPDSSTVVEAITSTATDKAGRSIGHTIVFNDITAERRRQQRIQVLIRVLRHNLRNDLNVVRGYVTLLGNDDGKPREEYETRITSTIDRLMATGNKAQDLERVLEAAPFSDSPTQLKTIVEEAVTTSSIEAGDATLTVEVPSEVTVWISPNILRPIFIELIKNSIEHADSPNITVRFSSDQSVVSVIDDGPGIPKDEINVINSAGETPLEHTSGLGLWLIKWGTEIFGGTVEFNVSSSGTTVRIQLPQNQIDLSLDED